MTWPVILLSLHRRRRQQQLERLYTQCDGNLLQVVQRDVSCLALGVRDEGAVKAALECQRLLGPAALVATVCMAPRLRCRLCDAVITAAMRIATTKADGYPYARSG